MHHPMMISGSSIWSCDEKIMWFMARRISRWRQNQMMMMMMTTILYPVLPHHHSPPHHHVLDIIFIRFRMKCIRIYSCQMILSSRRIWILLDWKSCHTPTGFRQCLSVVGIFFSGVQIGFSLSLFPLISTADMETTIPTAPSSTQGWIHSELNELTLKRASEPKLVPEKVKHSQQLAKNWSWKSSDAKNRQTADHDDDALLTERRRRRIERTWCNNSFITVDPLAEFSIQDQAKEKWISIPFYDFSSFFP